MVPWRFQDMEFFLEQVPWAEVANEICALCGEHLRRQVAGAHQGREDPRLKGCVRLRSCGHELHAACFSELVKGSKSRTSCTMTSSEDRRQRCQQLFSRGRCP